MIPFVRRVWNHHLQLTVALTETGSAHSFSLRSAWLGGVLLFALSGWLALVLAGDLAGARLTATLTGNSEVKYYLDIIAELRAERDADKQQLTTIAEQLGVLQARLDRFDALGNKLKAEGTLLPEDLGDEPIEGKGGTKASKAGQGGPLNRAPKTLMTLVELQKKAAGLESEADLAEVALETSLAMAVRKALGPVQGGGIPYLWPLMSVSYRLSSPFGWREDPVHGKRAWHAGMDMADAQGNAVVAAADGVVSFVGWRAGYGNLVVVEHEQDFSTRYGHLQKGVAKVGQRVNAGDLIALLGNTGRSTGAHLHFEVRKNDQALNPFPFIRESRSEVFQQARNGRGQELLTQYRQSLQKASARR
jgi:murein DD-endopeptidase MepM/ murein hydrolase activator NlpD